MERGRDRVGIATTEKKKRIGVKEKKETQERQRQQARSDRAPDGNLIELIGRQAC